LLKRRDCEYELFQSVEVLHVLPRLREGFPTVDDFVDFANAVLNRRKSRSGRSLELHAKAIFDEENVAYSWTPVTEGRKTPDFVFPGIDQYRDSAWPTTRLRMLAAKTSCKDRWRQILNEADRIGRKHLLTLQEGISVAQYEEMKSSGVVLVVPSNRIADYPESVQPEILSFEGFIREVRALL